MGSAPKKPYRFLGGSGQTSATAETREKEEKVSPGDNMETRFAGTVSAR